VQDPTRSKTNRWLVLLASICLGLLVTTGVALAQPVGRPRLQTDSPLSPPATPTSTETLEVTPEPAPSTEVAPRPEPSPTRGPTPTSVPIPTATLPATAKPTPTFPVLPPEVRAFLSENERWLLGGCIGLASLVLLLVLVILIVRAVRRRARGGPAHQAGELSAQSTAWLEITGTHKEPRRFPLKPEGTTLGRASDNDLVIARDFPGWETVSPHHARIYRHGSRWVLEDLKSANGVYVDGIRTGRNLLRDGWRVGIGGVEFVFRGGGSQAKEV
jgi:hypothetical protein